MNVMQPQAGYTCGNFTVETTTYLWFTNICCVRMYGRFTPQAN